MACVKASIHFGVDARLCSAGSLDDCVPWSFADVRLTIGVYLLRRGCRIEGQRVRSNANDGSWLSSERAPKGAAWACGLLTIFLVVSELVEMTIARRGLVDSLPVGDLREQWAWVLGERMQRQTIARNAQQDLPLTEPSDGVCAFAIDGRTDRSHQRNARKQWVMLDAPQLEQGVHFSPEPPEMVPECKHCLPNP